MRRRLVGLLVVPVFVLAGCGAEDAVNLPDVPDVPDIEMPNLDVLNEGVLEGANGVKEFLAQEYDLTDVGSVDCPGELALQFDCNVSVAGEEKTVTVTVLNENGEFEVSEPK
ncbi:DUF4333 domain-containing protein [Actinophytocola gossypii]|uniref:DUF4333 domain-containing protein n=1 Tax=Actinophytocola gossypii TaxID=2812003 RepID=A0ABT2J6Y9_9PSEU|nr:DUF4333 domain-containing protein [Actinophytocola gossypii]MCT2583627.1 DUF4333 domain-containing protein [Actinophytocola gossypii]